LSVGTDSELGIISISRGFDAPNSSDRTVSSYFGAFAPAARWEELVWWPPDVFALANLVLDNTWGYRFVVAPPAGRRWPPLPHWNADVREASRAWGAGVGRQDGQLPALVRRCWEIVCRGRETPLAKIRSGEAWELAEALLTLHSTADEACAEVAVNGSQAATESFESQAWCWLQEHGSLARLSPTRVRIMPKTHFSSQGITIRSLSRYLALCYESVDVRWKSVELESGGRRDYNIVLLPWPLSVRGSDFRPAGPGPLENMDADLFGFFEFAPRVSLNCALLASVLQAARERVGIVDAVVLPEGAACVADIEALQRALDRFGVNLFITGVRQPGKAGTFGSNYLHLGVRSPAGWLHYRQDKHHRWCLDERQIRQYHLGRVLNPKKLWWEAIDVGERSLHVIDVGSGVATVALVCEDLARVDEVADLVRRIGPSLVLALLLDGPQLTSRWSGRYASLLVDEPGSTVLTLTSYGMAARSRPPQGERSRVVAHWNNARDGTQEIELARGATAILLSAALDSKTLWTADGRRHGNVPSLALSGIHQLHAAGLTAPS
jgi:hypothetical protein